MRTVLSGRSRLVASLFVLAALAVAGAAQAQSAAAQAAKSAARSSSGQSAMSPYAKSVTPAKAAAESPGSSDPFERVNRKIFAFNQGLDKVLIRPLAVFWHHAAPQPIRQGINNFLSNLGEPVVFINDVLQGHPATAAGTATRFVANSTIGLLGVIDVTGKTGLPHHDNGFGLTLGRWGVKSGPYLYLPVLGPSTVRDGIGQGIDLAANPLPYARRTGDGGLTTGLGIIGGLDARAEADSDLKALQALSTDQYAALRSFYLQNRQAQITGGKIDLDALPDFDDPGVAAVPAPGAVPLPAPVPAPAPAPGNMAEADARAGDPATAPAAPAPTASGFSQSDVQLTLDSASTTTSDTRAEAVAATPPATSKGV